MSLPTDIGNSPTAVAREATKDLCVGGVTGSVGRTPAFSAAMAANTLVMDAGHARAERFNPSGAAHVDPPFFGGRLHTGTVPAFAAVQAQAEAIGRYTPPAEPLPAPKSADQGQAPQADGAADPNAPAAPTTTRLKVVEFLQRCLPWPADDDQGFVNLHAHLPIRKGKQHRFMAGKPTRDVNQFLSLAHGYLTNQNPPDLYFCMSRQSQTMQDKFGGQVAVKKQEFALAVKALWLDIDVKEKGYTDIKQALTAVTKFYTDKKLPPPTFGVQSGGGLHVYWASDRPLTPVEWRPYAEGLKQMAIDYGLKCDTGLTGDIARILRVPGTYNYKTGTARPVKLLWSQEYDLDFAKDLAVLPTIVPHRLPTVSASILTGGPDPAFAGMSCESLSAGISEERFVNPAPVFSGCPHFAEAVATGAADFGQPLWNLTTLAATFMEGGHDLAHNMAKGHAEYVYDTTEELWERKVEERKSRGLGWPSCVAFQSAGCKHCATCPHFGKIKSPLNLAGISRPSAVPPAPNEAAHQTKQSKNPIATLMSLRHGGTDINSRLRAMNEKFAVVKYGGQIVIADFSSRDINFMKVDDLHKMFANVIVYIEKPAGNNKVVQGPRILSKQWFGWEERRQYIGRGVVFEPGGPHEVANDMLNLWRGFGVEPKQGDWSLMRAHIIEVVCSGNTKHFNYLIRWMAYRVQHPDKPIGVAVALLGAQGAGKGIVARTFGSFFGKHFAHITHGDQLTGRFNASLATSCVVFLDEALWAGDRKGEGTLKALITEPTFQLEAKFRDPIMVENRLSIIVASNNDWAVPAGVGDRRWFVLNVASTYAGMAHRDYWDALFREISAGGAGAMLHDLLAMDLNQFDVRAIPHTTAKAQQQAHSLRGSKLWLYHVLQEGVLGGQWASTGQAVSKVAAYGCYDAFSKARREQPALKSVWAKDIHKALGGLVTETRRTVNGERFREFIFAPLDDCRRAFANHIGAPDLEWEEPEGASQQDTGSADVQTAANSTINEKPETQQELDSHPDERVERQCEPEDDDLRVEWEPEPDDDDLGIERESPGEDYLSARI